MKLLLLLILLLPLASALNISVDYPNRMELGVETEFGVEIDNPSGEFYDIKIDIIQNGKRVSKIIDSGKTKSSMYYLNGALQDKGSFYLIVDEAKAEGAEVIFKVRDSSGKTYTFSDYEIIFERKTLEKGASLSKVRGQDSEEEESGSHTTQIIEKEREEIDILEEVPPKIISLNPKTIKTDKNSQKDKAGLEKYLFLIFSFVLLTLYIIKPKKKKNEFRY